MVRRPGSTIDAGEITRHVGAHLARFKVPRDVVFVEALPRNALGKVQHFRLRDIATGRTG